MFVVWLASWLGFYLAAGVASGELGLLDTCALSGLGGSLNRCLAEGWQTGGRSLSSCRHRANWGGYHGTLASALCLGDQGPGISVATVESDESPCVEHPHAAGGLLRRRGA
jgi:hypothetical protein